MSQPTIRVEPGWWLAQPLLTGAWCGTTRDAPVTYQGQANWERPPRPKIVRHHVVPLTKLADGVFQRNNARLHTAWVCSVNVLSWPARSADISPTEHLWGRVRQMNLQPQSLEELFLALHNKWQNTSQRTITHPGSSLRRRCAAVTPTQGGHNRYWTFRQPMVATLQR